ncbi:MAG: hypothetical protein Kow0056_07240 [Coriobacteriia bacterium]
MDPSNKELYELALHDAPYVIAAYGILWVALIVYVSTVLRRLIRLEKEIEAVEASVRRKSGQDA